MATAPKSVPKIVPAAEAAAPAAAPKKSKKKLILIILIALLVLGGGGGAAWFFLGRGAAHGEGAAAQKQQPAKPPVFLAMDSFTVNLQPETGEQFLQISFTVQVADQAQVDLFKLYMPQARSRLLLLLSGKKPSEISSVEGKKKLAAEIITSMKQPFSANAPPQSVSDVFFTSFVIQ